MEDAEWTDVAARIGAWADRWERDPEWAESVKLAHIAWENACHESAPPGRPEAWGTKPEEARHARQWTRLLVPLTWVANLPSLPTQLFIDRFVSKTVKKVEFVSTMRLGFGILLFPLTWLVWSAVAGLLAPDGLGWAAAGLVWVWGQGGSRTYAWSQSEAHARRDQTEGARFWGDAHFSDVREAWKGYLALLDLGDEG